MGLETQPSETSNFRHRTVGVSSATGWEKSPSPSPATLYVLQDFSISIKMMIQPVCNTLQQWCKFKTHLSSLRAWILIERYMTYIAVIWVNLQEDCRIRFEFSDLLALLWFAMSESEVGGGGATNPVEEIECLNSHK